MGEGGWGGVVVFMFGWFFKDLNVISITTKNCLD